MDIQTLFTALKTKYPQSGLSDNEIKGIAAGLFATGLVTDENVAAIVDAQKDAMRGFQSLFDSRFVSRRDDFLKTAEASFKEKYHIDDDGKQIIETPKQQDRTMEAFTKLLDERPYSNDFYLQVFCSFFCSERCKIKRKSAVVYFFCCQQSVLWWKEKTIIFTNR